MSCGASEDAFPARGRVIVYAMAKSKITLRYLAKNLSTVVGLVLVWRGIWYVLDGIDALLFGGSHTWMAVIGIAIGLAMLYLPDQDLKEIEKL